MKQGEKNTLLYIGIIIVWVLLLIIIGPLLHNKSPENQEKNTSEQNVDTPHTPFANPASTPLQDIPQPPFSNPVKPAVTPPKEQNRPPFSTNTTYLPNKNQGDTLAYSRQGSSYFKKGCVVVIIAIVVVIIVGYRIGEYNWIWEHGLDSLFNPISPYVFNNEYGYRTSYDHLFLSRPAQDYYALLPINAAKLSYGSTGHNSLSRVVHKLKALAGDRRNKGLFITIHSKDEEKHDTLISSCLTLVTAIETYKQQTKGARPVIAFSKTLMPKGYCIATAADKIFIEGKGTLTMHVSVLIQLFALRNANNQPLNHKAQVNVAQDGDQLVYGTYKVTPCENDIRDNFKKCYQDPYIQCVTKRKSSIQQQNYWFQNIFNTVVENATKFTVFVKNKSSSVNLLEGLKITFQDAYRMGLVDDCDQKQNIINKLSYPVQKCHVHFPSLTLEEKWALIQQPAIEVVFIKGFIGRRLSRSIAPLLMLLAKAKQVKGIIFVIDSRGGYSDSGKAISTMLTTLKGAGKCIFTYTEGYCCSAAYQIGCIAHKIFASETAYIGSIGVRTRTHKVSSNIFLLIIKKLKAYDLKRCGEDFVNHVAYHRAQSLNTDKERLAQIVGDTEARTFHAKNAKHIGLIDEIGTLDTTIAAMKRTLQAPNIKVFYREHRT